MISYLKIRQLSFVSFWLWLFFILFLMIRPASAYPKFDIPGLDKVVHFILFFVLGFLYVAQQMSRKTGLKHYLKSPGFYLVMLFTLGIEFFQLFLDTRSFEYLDMLTNGLSFVIGIFTGTYLFRTKQK